MIQIEASHALRVRSLSHFTSSSPFAVALVSALLGAWFPEPAWSQAVEPEPPDWSMESEVGASVFFGASDQTTVAAKVKAARTSSLFEVESDLAYLYGEATNGDGVTFVNKRSWSAGVTLDYRGYSWVNPYGFGSASSSLEKKIEVRYQGGAGAKFTAFDSDATNLDFALAVLAEKTVQSNDGDGTAEVLARWAGEASFRRTLSEDRIVFEAKTEYNPVFDQFANYTVEGASSIAFKLSEVISLKLSVEDNYDSRAEERGARSNNDGRVLFSVLSSFSP